VRIAKKSAVSFKRLVASIRQAHEELTAQAARAVNASLTLRNWLIGLYIAEYEQNGVDRARYGDRLLDRLSSSLLQAGVSRAETRELRRYRQFYITYPQIRESLSPELKVPAREIVAKLSFSHIAELLKCDDATKRAFYEIECIRGNWSVRELQRQVNSLYYERSGLSHDKVKYRKNMMVEGDNPPVGILLCTQKDHALVEYALAGLENGIFVSKYLLELPKKEEMQRFIEAQLAGAMPQEPAGV
jgi:hypothetical protein